LDNGIADTLVSDRTSPVPTPGQQWWDRLALSTSSEANASPRRGVRPDGLRPPDQRPRKCGSLAFL